jgi:hypothetical protein
MCLEHAVSNPIMVQGRAPQYGAMMMSPRSMGDQSGILHQMVENVLSSSPGSLTVRDIKYVVSVNRQIDLTQKNRAWEMNIRPIFTFIDLLGKLTKTFLFSRLQRWKSH